MTKAYVTGFRIRFSRALRQKGGLLLQETNFPKTNPTRDLRRKKFISVMRLQRLQHTPSGNHRSLRRREIWLLVGFRAQIAKGRRRRVLGSFVRGFGRERLLA